MGPQTNTTKVQITRTNFWYAGVLIIVGIFLLRAFYLQVIRYNYYHHAALSDQLKEYEIMPERGTINAHMGDTTVPIVLNEKLYTIYADPSLIKKPDVVAATMSDILGGSMQDYKNDISRKDTRYVILAKKVNKEVKNRLLAKKYPGVGADEVNYRTYPNGSLAAQVLGFVNAEGQGVYGLEQSLNGQLAGTPGQLKAVTDINGVPLAASPGNILRDPVAGKDVTLTLDVGMQKQLEDILKKGVERAKAPSASALIMDLHTGAVKAMANYPTYNPANYGEVEDASLFNNAAVSHPIEVGSTMKVLTTASALNQGVIKPDTTYYDPSHYVIDDFTVKNIEEDGGAGTKSVADILNLSLNTGATWELMQMGGGQLNLQAREKWNDYMVNHYRFSKTTGIEQNNEAAGYVPGPENNGAGINLTYANTSFGQAMTATAIQMGAALSAVLNGGTFYQPTLVDSYVDGDGNTVKNQPKVLAKDVVSAATADEMIPLMEYVVEHHTFNPKFDQKAYAVGGKTGTAQIAKEEGGGYYEDLYNGTYTGFVGGDTPQYVIVVFVNKPKIAGYAGSQAAQPIFGDLAHMLIDDFGVIPKTK